MGEFFTKAAFVTFCGAYAVLPYIYQGGVDQHHWLTATQMMDDLVLGKTTPGSLIIVAWLYKRNRKRRSLAQIQC